jgi:Icc-related predicted phosphoesterase
MKAAVLSDLHFNQLEKRKGVRMAAERAADSGADVILIAGDIASGSYERYDQCLSFFGGFTGPKLAIWGNHDTYPINGETSWERRETLREVFRGHGFHMLDNDPIEIGGKVFVGNMGWYDYSFLPKDNPDPRATILHNGKEIDWNGISEEVLANKRLKFLDRKGRKKETYWPDRNNTEWGCTDREVCDIMNRELEDGILSAGGKPVVAVTHMLPLKEMASGKRSVGIAYGNAFLGSESLGKVLSKYQNVGTAICGHIHRRGHYRRGQTDFYIANSNPQVMEV